MRQLDHIVVAVRDLERAANLYRGLGFNVGPRNQHPWGTENRLIQFAGCFMELITLGAAADQIVPHLPRQFSFGAFVQDFLRNSLKFATTARVSLGFAASLGSNVFESVVCPAFMGPCGLPGIDPGACKHASQAHCCLGPAEFDCAISRGSRMRLCAAQLKTNSQSTFSRPRNFTCRSGPVCLSHPKPFSTSQRRLRLMA